MKLYFAHTSPYARKVRIVVLEMGLQDRIEMVFQNPFEDSALLGAANPLGKVPCLIAADGQAIYDSPVICAYLANMVPASDLAPAGSGRWTILVAEALADGILDAAFAMVMERRRPSSEQSAFWLERWQATILRTIRAADENQSPFRGEITIAQIALASALGYLDFRLPDVDWRESNAETAAWFETFAGRPSMHETRPPKG